MHDLTQNSSNQTSDLELLTKDELRQEIHRNVAQTIAAIRRTAECVLEWHRRGFDVHDLGLTLGQKFLLVGMGRVLAETLYYFGDSEAAWRSLVAMPLDVQQRLIEARAVAVFAADGSERMVELETITSREARLVFDTGRGCLRTPDEQRVMLERMAALRRANEPEFVPELDVPYRITSRGVEVLEPVAFTWSQLESLQRQRPKRQKRAT